MKTLFKSLGFGLLLLALFGFGYSWRDISQAKAPSVRAFASIFDGGGKSPTAAPDQIFKQSYNRILSDYYKTVKPVDLKYAGMEGLMASLGDPHTLFLPPRAAQDFALETKAKFVGVGARLQGDPLGARVTTVFDDGPAFKAGLKAGDIITAVDGKSAVGKDINDIVDTIRGKEGTNVKLTVIRSTQAKPLVLTAKRASITTPTVDYKYLPENRVGYLSIASFSEPTAEQFDSALEKLNRNEMQGLVIDVRGNPGGLLETATDLLSRFLDDKVVVRMRMKDGTEEVVRTYGGMKRPMNYPVVLLMDEDSASAAEIFAGALHDYRMATLVGTHSYGKASVQNVYELVDRSSAKITIARYFLPATPDIGRKVDEDGQYLSGGLTPDVTVKQNQDMDVVLGDPKTDVQLRKALEIIKSKAR